MSLKRNTENLWESHRISGLETMIKSILRVGNSYHILFPSFCGPETKSNRHLHPISVLNITSRGGSFLLFTIFNDYITSGFIEYPKSRESNTSKNFPVTHCKYYRFWLYYRILTLFAIITKNNPTWNFPSAKILRWRTDWFINWT